PSGTADTAVTVTGLRQAYLPVPSTITAVQARGDWRYNAVNPAIYGVNTSTLHLAYTATSSVYDPTSDYLNSLAQVAATPTLEPYLVVPDNLPAQVLDTANQIISAAGAVTPYEKALALQAWFQAGTYDITIKTGTNANALVTFLNNRRGFCEQFAATMALMARLEGIPARVDVGFTPGTKIGSTNSYLVTTADAHAWPELYFPGAGWLRFEPTPRADGQTSDPPYADAVIGPQPGASAGGVPNDAVVKPQIPSGRPEAGSAGGSTTRHGWSLSKVSTGWLIAVLVVLVGLLISPAVRFATRRRRWTAADTEAARAHAAWDELGDDMRDLGLDWRGDSDTPRRAAATLVASRRLAYDVAAQQALSRLTRAEELARYAARPDELRWVDQDPRTDEKTVRKALFTSVSRVRRLRARVAPPSTSRIASSAFGWVADSWHGVAVGLSRQLRRPFDRGDD
ncbi:MAG TPA: transglutaminase-like domain-containing protein, partial [Acidothermaceae bacterium]|nr:transglutaminase-like domain-containing protein [Acidothermaceae bacterium]